MKRKELARELARTQRLAAAVAQDQIDQLVHDILRKLRAGEPVDLPGLGKLMPPAASEKR
jgi:nucleoid DNA-binding protein